MWECYSYLPLSDREKTFKEVTLLACFHWMCKFPGQFFAVEFKANVSNCGFVSPDP